MSRISLVIVSHSSTLAEGVREVAMAMAPEVTIVAAGGRKVLEEEALGTDADRIKKALDEALVDAEGVVVLTDIGSSVMTAETVVEKMDSEDIRIVDAPLVEGAVAAAVTAQLDGDLREVVASAVEAGERFTNASLQVEGTSALDAAFAEAPQGSVAIADGSARAVAVVGHAAGLHARPSALLARLAGTYSALVTIDGVDVSNATELMARHIKVGQTVVVEARGADSVDAVVAVVKGIEFPESLG